MRTRLSKRGFTLIELMVVVAILGIAVAAVIPSIAQAMRDRRVQQAALNIMDPFRIARTRAMMRGNAHMVVMVFNGAVLDGYVFEGNSGSCRTSAWGTSLVPATTGATGPWEIFRTPTPNPEDQMVYQILRPVGVAALQICYPPSGRTFYRFAPGSAWFDGTTIPGVASAAIPGGFTFQVETATGTHVARRIFVPLGGTPRTIQ